MQSSFVKAKLFWESQAATQQQPQQPQQPQRRNPTNPHQPDQPTRPPTPSIIKAAPQSTPLAYDSLPSEENKGGTYEQKVDTSHETEREDDYEPSSTTSMEKFVYEKDETKEELTGK